jgi:hypothetical protein
MSEQGAYSNSPPLGQQEMRLLECWLLLAQDANVQCGWNYNIEQLEALILEAAPQLAQAASAAEARGILWYRYLLRCVRQP